VLGKPFKQHDNDSPEPRILPHLYLLECLFDVFGWSRANPINVIVGLILWAMIIVIVAGLIYQTVNGVTMDQVSLLGGAKKYEAPAAHHLRARR